MNNKTLAAHIVDQIDLQLMLRFSIDARSAAENIVEESLNYRDGMGVTRLARFKRWWHGGYEYGHTGESSENPCYRRNVRTGVVELRVPCGYVPIHKSNWHKFVAVELS